MEKGQSIVEYIMVLGIIVIVLYAMAPTFKRGVQGIIKATADQISVQQNSDQSFGPSDSYINYSSTLTDTNNRRSVYERAGLTNTVYDESTGTATNVMTNMGFSF